MAEPDPAQSLAGRIGAHALHAKYDSRELTAKGRAKWLGSFYEKTDPSLPEAERLRRAEHLLRAHMTRLALRSVKVRKARKRDPK